MITTYYQVLNTDNNRRQNISYHITKERPQEGVDYHTLKWNGVFYLEDSVPEELSALLNTLYRTRERCRFIYGDTKTGEKWGDVDTGRVRRTTGTIKIPITVYNSRAAGGPALHTSCIVKVETTRGKKVLFDMTRK